MPRAGRALLLLGLALACPRGASAQAAPPVEGAHDFDFEIGSWTVANSRLMHRPNGTTEWIHFRGTSVARPVWGGQGDVVELESDAPYGHTRALIVRLFDPTRGEWRTTFAGANDGTLGPPLIGRVRETRGELVGADSIGGQPVLVRHVLLGMSPTHYRLEQSVSRDGGRSWELDWISEHTRVP